MSDPTAGLAETWTHTTAEIPERGLEETFAASPDQRARLATELEILDIQRLQVRYRILPLSGGRYRLTGTIEARVVQACVVTLDPVETRITDQIDAEFRPPEDIRANTSAAEEEQAILAAEEHEAIDNHRLAVGRVVVESLAAALPTHPRAPGAELEQHEAKPADDGTGSPFAALADWKSKPK